MIRPVISVSGGKDSTAAYLLAIDQYGQDFRAVAADTDNEHPVTMNYIRNLHLMAGGPTVEIVKADFSERLQKKNIEPSGNAFLDMMIWKGRAPSSKAQFCTEHVKLVPIRDWLETWRKREDEILMITGIRAGESERRSKMPEREWSDFYDCETYRPLLKWSESDVFALLETKGVPPNPLYALGMSRVGCFPCIHARKSELARMPDWAWDKLDQWEKRLGRSFFAAGAVPGIFIPSVSDVREWSKTSRGGKQVELIQPASADPPSCMATWGACE